MHGEESITTELEKWKRKVRVHVKKIKVNPLDETETDFVDVDMVLKYYMEDYRALRQ